MKTEDFDIDIEQEARGHRVQEMSCLPFVSFSTGGCLPFHCRLHRL